MGNLMLRGQPRQHGPVYDPYAAALFARLPATPSALRRKLVNDLIVNLRDHAAFETKLDALYLLAMGMDDPGYATANDAFAARRNWVQDAFNLTAVGSPAFVTDRYYAGDGVGAYLATGFNPTTAPTPKFIRDSACIFTWERSALAAATTSSLGASAGNRVSLVPRSTGDIFRSALNAALAGTLTVVSNVGLSAADRPNSTDVLHIKDGVLVETVAAASEAVVSGDFDLMRRNGTVYRASSMAVAGFGASLGTAGHAALRSALNTYLNAVGAV
ncbi:hypothetical protein [Kaistia terrae]|uniref:Uncharacterized protein n=1 Tax=Kaistia terrae TaxID=537017 RepID=A0ABW0Q295_9HYPH|nr:hypothetical protein [Kaistia terrae]MCX5581486.1 hypothetical protein [Kaistia terrae]